MTKTCTHAVNCEGTVQQHIAAKVWPAFVKKTFLKGILHLHHDDVWIYYTHKVFLRIVVLDFPLHLSIVVMIYQNLN